MSTDIEFLRDLQLELNTQDDDSQAAPRFWTVGDYQCVECNDGNEERYSVYLPNAGESHEINYFLLDNEELAYEALEAFKEIGCEDSAHEWILEYYDDGASLHPEKKKHFIRENTMFLTKSEAKQHIKSNHYHYTDEAHTYAMTAWRAPKVEKLLKILSEFDFGTLRDCAIVPTE